MAGSLWPLVRDTVRHWLDDNVMTLAAALAFYAVLSIAPLLLIALSMTAAVFGNQVANDEVLHQLDLWVGPDGAKGVHTVLEHVGTEPSSRLGSFLSGVVALVGASGVFSELRHSLDIIWHAPRLPKRSTLSFAREQLFAFVMVLGTGVLLLVSVAATALLSTTGAVLTRWLHGVAWPWQVGNHVASALLAVALFTAVFKLLPTTHVRTRDAFVGATLTAALFTLGKLAIGIYLARAAIGSRYGAAGSVVVFIVWVYYSAQIFFFGAEFTQVFAKRFAAPERSEPQL